MEDDVDVLVEEEGGNAEDGLPPLAISFMRSNGLRSSPLSFEAPILPKPPTLPSPEAPLSPPAPVSEGMAVVDEVYAVLNKDSEAELDSPAKPASPNLDRASGETLEPAKRGCKKGIVPAAAAAHGNPAIELASNLGNFPPLPIPLNCNPRSPNLLLPDKSNGDSTVGLT